MTNSDVVVTQMKLHCTTTPRPRAKANSTLYARPIRLKLRLRLFHRRHNVQQPLLHPDRDFRDNMGCFTLVCIDGRRPAGAYRHLTGDGLIGKIYSDGIKAV